MAHPIQYSNSPKKLTINFHYMNEIINHYLFEQNLSHRATLKNNFIQGQRSSGL